MTDRRNASSVIASLQSLLHDLPQVVSERVTLLSLELRRAMRALALLVALVIGAAVLLATAWIALWMGVAAALLDAGMARHWVALLVLVLNAGAALGLLLMASSKTRLLALPATVRSLTVPTHAASRRAGEASATPPSDRNPPPENRP